MKVALVHDYLNQYGGGERVLEALAEMFPDAPIYTLLYDEAATRGRFQGRVRGTSFLDFPFARRHHRLFIPLMPLAARTLNLGEEYDLVISDTAGFAKGICYGARTKHLSYIHTPLRYAWEQDEYLSPFMSHVALTMSRPLLNYLKRWDYGAAQKPDALIANSQFIAGKIKRYYGRDVRVIYPPVATEKFYYNPTPHTLHPTPCLAVGRLLHYKRFDLIIDAFARLGLPLKIVGEGPEQERIKNQISKIKNMEWQPFIENEDELRKLYAGAKALIFPQTEDFGLVAAEALSCGTPVIAYAQGGAREMIEDGRDGVLFHEQTADALAAAVRRSEGISFDRRAIAERARRFGKDLFVREFTDAVRRVTMESNRSNRSEPTNTSEFTKGEHDTKNANVHE